MKNVFNLYIIIQIDYHTNNSYLFVVYTDQF